MEQNSVHSLGCVPIFFTNGLGLSPFPLFVSMSRLGRGYFVLCLEASFSRSFQIFLCHFFVNSDLVYLGRRCGLGPSVPGGLGALSGAAGTQWLLRSKR